MTADSTHNLATARAYLAAMGEADVSVIDRTMADDVVFTVISAISPETPSAIPWAGQHRGREAVRAYYRRLAAGQSNRVDAVERWVADNDTVVAFTTLHAHSPQTGRSGSWEIVIRFDFVEGLIARFSLYEDSFSAVVLHSDAGQLRMVDPEGTRLTPIANAPLP